MRYIDIVFDGPPHPTKAVPSGIFPGGFVEVEDDSGKSISIGEWVERDDGYWALRIPNLANVAGFAEKQQKRIELLESTLRTIQALPAHDDSATLAGYAGAVLHWCRDALGEGFGGVPVMHSPRKIWGELHIGDDDKAHLDVHIHSSVTVEKAEAVIHKFLNLVRGKIERSDVKPLHIQERPDQEKPDYHSLYSELIMEVQNKYPGESRHDTAKRYIREQATPCAGCRGDSDTHTCQDQCTAAEDQG